MIRRNSCISENEVEEYVDEKLRVPTLWPRVLWALGHSSIGHTGRGHGHGQPSSAATPASVILTEDVD